MPVVQRNTEDLTAIVQRVFRQGWPETDADVTSPAVLRAHVESFADNLEAVVTRLHRRLRWAMDQIRRLNLRAKVRARSSRRTNRCSAAATIS